MSVSTGLDGILIVENLSDVCVRKPRVCPKPNILQGILRPDVLKKFLQPYTHMLPQRFSLSNVRLKGVRKNSIFVQRLFDVGLYLRVFWFKPFVRKTEWRPSVVLVCSSLCSCPGRPFVKTPCSLSNPWDPHRV